MKLLLARSADGFYAKDKKDDMKWTSAEDKRLFMLLTLWSEDILLVGRETFYQMPSLPGRQLVMLSRKRPGFDLEEADLLYSQSTLIGGPTVAIAALEKGLIDQACIVVNNTCLHSGLRCEKLEELLVKTFTSKQTFMLGALVATRFSKGLKPV